LCWQCFTTTECSTIGDEWLRERIGVVDIGGGTVDACVLYNLHVEPNSPEVDDPQHAIARGCARRARMLVAQMAMERAA
jgi:hypothetical protein